MHLQLCESKSKSVGLTIPFSVTNEVIKLAGVTSNAGLKTSTPPMGLASTSPESRCSISISFPSDKFQSNVEVGAAT